MSDTALAPNSTVRSPASAPATTGMPSTWLGLDCGTCSASAAVLIGGQPRPVRDRMGPSLAFPSAVYNAGDALLVGQAAEFARAEDPGRFWREFKRDFGKPVRYQLGDREFTPQDLTRAVLVRLKTEAEGTVGGSGRLAGAVVTVPAAYTDYKRALMLEVTRAAGFAKVELLDEPVAALLYYEHYTGRTLADGEAVLVYHLGGGTFDGTLWAKKTGRFEPLAQPKALPACGGGEFDRLLFTDLCRHGGPALAGLLAPDPTDLDTLRRRDAVCAACRDLKHQLSATNRATLYVTQLNPPLRYALERRAFEALIEPEVANTVRSCRDLVQEAGLPKERPPRMLLVGGSSRIPLVGRLLQQEFGRAPQEVDEPELAVCLGAALHGAHGAGRRRATAAYQVCDDIWGNGNGRGQS